MLDYIVFGTARLIRAIVIATTVDNKIDTDVSSLHKDLVDDEKWDVISLGSDTDYN